MQREQQIIDRSGDESHRATARKVHRVHRVSVTVLTSLVILLAGCSSDGREREYAVPGTLCGTAVETDALSPFLPAGREITVKDRSYSGSKGCEVIVDNKLIVTTTQIWMQEGTTTAFVAARQSLDDPDHTAENGRFVYSSYEAFGKTRTCVDTKYKQELFTVIRAEGSKHGDAEAMKRLILSFTGSVEKSAECKAGAE
ncbi:hypothetical protein G9272_32930 [Streptomyces asoensis]|uniref:Uncharacterized protein n=1 Tax=Streptomyces asoensis TaxID=249586 RepID=A0A6M4WX45_9ACTN|nr:hypothetical protein [Streptomyces asoensis]QJT04512.1 hypothetical protein G9272_32930 [Streptomyces asoensis]